MNKIIISLLLLVSINASALVPTHSGNLYFSEEIEEEVVENDEEPAGTYASFNG